MISGAAGIVVVDRDTVELRDGQVYVNHESFGNVPQFCEIRYVVSKTSRTLYVDGKSRSPLLKK